MADNDQLTAADSSSSKRKRNANDNQLLSKIPATLKCIIKIEDSSTSSDDDEMFINEDVIDLLIGEVKEEEMDEEEMDRILEALDKPGYAFDKYSQVEAQIQARVAEQVAKQVAEKVSHYEKTQKEMVERMEIVHRLSGPGWMLPSC